jgi:hypothetical protein
MTEEADIKGKPKPKKITFKCRFCEKTKPIEKMVTLPGYFPPIVACRECEKKMR